ncbi:MAG: adenosine deaminase [Verrucomicrobia bacterium]|nr:MAG: adenosine deaminase [Verrucomicrobiota bacterium]
MARIHLALLPLLVGLSASFAPANPDSGFAARWEAIKEETTPEQLYRLLYDLPKGGDLHTHFDGSFIPELLYRAATDPERNGGAEFFTRTKILNCDPQPLPLVYYININRATLEGLPACVQEEFEPLADLSPEQQARWASSLKLDLAGEGRDEFFERHWTRLGQINTIDMKLTLLVENMQLFGAEGVRYLEYQLTPFGITDADGHPAPPDAVADRIRERLRQPDALATGVTVRLQAASLRFTPDAEDRVRRNYAFVDRHRDLYVGVNLVGREDNQKGYPLRFLNVFREMRRQYSGIGISLHAGEADDRDAAIHDSLLLGATRIGHGLNLIRDPDTLLLMRNGPYLVEINLISNRLLDYTPDLSLHPFPEYLRLGVPVCLNTDDRGMWDSTMTDEYYSAVTTFGLTWPEIVQLGEDSLAYSFAEDAVKTRLIEDYRRRVDDFEDRYLSDDSLKRLEHIKPVAFGYAERTWGFDFKPF